MNEPRALAEHFFRHDFGRLGAVLPRPLGLRRTPTCGKGEMDFQWMHNQRGRPMAKNDPTSSNKESRSNIRVDPERKAVIARAAKLSGHTISDVVLDNAYQMATELLADEGTIVLSKKQVAHIFAVLDHPLAKSVAAARKLLTERSILDG
jgi:uncharacterized protein (DUF1778 family)